MLKIITVHGFLQSSIYASHQNHQLEFVNHDFEQGHKEYICHRPVSIQIPVHSLKFDVTDPKRARDGWHEHTLAVLHLDKVKAMAKVEKIEEKIQSMIALPHFEAPAPAPDPFL
jgi:hypothetical protein